MVDKTADKTCGKCGAPLIKSDGGSYCSAMCGNEVKSTEERHKFLKANLDEIIGDCLFRGVVKTAAKWQISENCLYKTPEIHEALERKRAGLLEVPSTNGATPKLPEFSNDWTSEVQLKWLGIWEKLKV